MLDALMLIFEWKNLLAIVGGVAIGIFFGALPGLSAPMGIALMLPLTFGMTTSSGILLLVGVYCGATFAGSISAILINTPGTAASAATAADGFFLSQKGKASTALNMSIYASVTGALISGIALLLIAPQLARFALNFGAPEFFMLAIFGLTVIVSVSGKSIIKGGIVGCLGLLIGTIGNDPVDGISRFSFNSVHLLSGIDLIPIVIGLFALTEIFSQILLKSDTIAMTSKPKREKFTIREALRYRWTMFKSSVIGLIIGMIPGTGSAIASFVSYGEAKRSSKEPESFGKGSLHGIAASESANNGATGGTLIPLMTLGIPGDVVTAVLIGGFLIQGLTPGPLLFVNHGTVAYTIILGFILVNIVLFFQAKVAVRVFSKIAHIRLHFLLPIVLVLSLIGAYASNNQMLSVGIALFFGILGLMLRKYDFPITPMLIAVILGPIAEKALRQSLLISDGSFMIFFTRPFAVCFLILAIISVVIAYRQNRKLHKG